MGHMETKLPPAPVRFSLLKYMARSPAHYRWAVDHAGAEDREESVAMRLGSAVDALVFEHRQVIGYSGIRRGKAWDEFRDACSKDTVILNDREFDTANAMRDALYAHDEARPLLTIGSSQVRLEWEFEGTACGGTPDIFTDGRVVDLKTSRTSDPRQFRRHAGQMNYHAQLAWYRYGIARAGVSMPKEAYIVAIESAPPFPVVVYKLTERLLEAGDAAWRAWMAALKIAKDGVKWDAYASATVEWDIDNWTMGGPAAAMPDPEWMV